MEIDLQTLPKPKKPSKKELKLFEAYDKEVNKEKGKSDKEVKDEKKAPLKPIEKIKPQKQPPTKEVLTKPKTTKLKQETKVSQFPSFEEIGSAIQIKKDNTKAQKESRERSKELHRLYGEKFDALGREQKKFLTTNLKTIQSITQRELNYMGYPPIAIRTRQTGENLVEFYLYPNGDISDLKLIEYSDSSSLDSHTIELIKRAYKDYPYPKEKTLVRIKVIYNAF